MNAPILCLVVLAAALTSLHAAGAPKATAASPASIELWPAGAPGGPHTSDQETNVTKANDRQVAGKPVLRYGNVTNPTITIYRPPREKDTGTAVLVCPGGGYNIVAYDLEGTEVCEWLNSIGVTGVLLKYRVPKPLAGERYALALQDGQRALSLVRSKASELGLKTGRIGVLGFSAGGHLSALLAHGTDQRTYESVDSADQLSFRPDFTVLIYPAYLTVKEQGDKISPELNIVSNAPPVFVVMTQDDAVRVEMALAYAQAIQKVKVPLEVHIFPKGGHGYGLRRTADPVTYWPELAERWFGSRGLLKR